MSIPYIDGSGALRKRKTTSGDGTDANPDIFSFSDTGTYERLGDSSSSPINSPNDDGTLSSVIRGLWQNLLGSNLDSSDPAGSIHAKLRSLIADTIGLITDNASLTGSLMARLRALVQGIGLLEDASTQSGSLLSMVRYLAESNFVESQTVNAITVDTSLTTIIAFDCRGKNVLGVQLENIGNTDLSALQIQVRFHSNSPIWNTIDNIEVIDGSENLNGISSGSDGWFRLYCNGIESARIQSSVASGSTSILAYGIAE